MTTPTTVLKRHLDAGMIGVILALVIQSVTIVWWASGLDRRVAQLEKDIGPVSGVAVAVARLDERTAAINMATARIERRLEVVEGDR